MRSPADHAGKQRSRCAWPSRRGRCGWSPRPCSAKTASASGDTCAERLADQQQAREVVRDRDRPAASPPRAGTAAREAARPSRARPRRRRLGAERGAMPASRARGLVASAEERREVGGGAGRLTARLGVGALGPSNLGARFSRLASYASRKSGCAMHSPAPGPRPRSPRPSVHACSLSSICLVMRARTPARARAARPTRRLGHQSLAGHDAVVEADRGRPSALDEVAEQEQLARVRQADDPRQQQRGAHVRAGEADLGEDEGDLALSAAMRMSQRRGDHRAGAGHRAVEGGDDRPAALADRQDEVAGDPGELEQPARVLARRARR